MIPAGSSLLEDKQAQLLQRLRAMDSLLVAFSGGADSAYLAWAAHTAIGERSLAVTALSASFSAHDRAQAEAFVAQTGIRHALIETREFENPLYIANQAYRCYHCKDELFTRLDELAAARGCAAVAYGVNADDVRDFRPGHRAASEHRVLTPLLDAQLTKDEIRALSRRAGLSTWDRPASPCLSSRIPYGTPVTREALACVEQAEAELRRRGFRQFRVRYFGETARIEIGREEMPRALASNLCAEVADVFQRIGFAKVELDPAGYRQGSLNAALASPRGSSPAFSERKTNGRE
jgi:uncharacterized protein